MANKKKNSNYVTEKSTQKKEAIAKKKQDELSERLHKLEEIWDEYDVYDKTLG